MDKTLDEMNSQSKMFKNTKCMSQCQQAEPKKYQSFQNQISDRDYKIRVYKVIKGEKEVMRKKKPSVLHLVVYICPCHFVIKQKLTHHCKAIILQ